VFRRRRQADTDVDLDQETDVAADAYLDEVALPDEDAGYEPADAEAAAQGDSEEGGWAGAQGPWDSAGPYPARDRVDLGGLHIPVGPGHEIQLVMAEEHGAWVTVKMGDSELQVQAFAASKRGAIWDDVRGEIAAELGTAGGEGEEVEGTFGAELLARVPVEPGKPPAGLRTVRFVGVDGPRWFLRGLFSGPAATSPELAEPLEEVLRDIVVVRGDHPMPPRDMLPLRLPEEAQRALEEQQAAADGEKFQTPLNGFERGPEFTETR
jgi:Protein of unknown function (DUF3710)